MFIHNLPVLLLDSINKLFCGKEARGIRIVSVIAVICMSIKTVILRYVIYKSRKMPLRDSSDILECLELVSETFKVVDALALLALVITF